MDNISSRNYVSLTSLSHTLNNLSSMDNVSSRQAQRREADNIGNWMTKEVKLTLVKPPSERSGD